MSLGTVRAITDSFLRIAEKKRVDKITVRDIVDDCGINRTTFYYHFRDVFDIVEQLCHETVSDALTEGNAESATDALYALIADNRTLFRGILFSFGAEALERYLSPALSALTGRVLKEDCAGSAVSDDDRALIGKTYAHLIFYFASEWLKANENSSDDGYFRRVAALSRRALRQALSPATDEKQQ